MSTALALCWLVLISGLFWWEIDSYKNAVFELAAAEGRAAFNKDLVYRRWAAGHGGVYVPVTEETPPNPYLSGIDEKNISTPSGRLLTLMNPAYMTRQVHELAQQQYGVRGHITSLTPIRPENVPDDWERAALEAFGRGENEVVGTGVIDGLEYYRIMRPMLVEASCLKCHGYQGYREGDIRGGISISVPLAEYRTFVANNTRVLAIVHVVLFFIGLVSLGLAFSGLGRAESRRIVTQRALQESEAQLRTVFNAADNVAFVTTDLSGEDTRILGFSPGAEKLLGYSADEVLGTRIARLLPAGAEEDFSAMQRELKRTGEGIGSEEILRRKSGEEFPALFSLQPVFDVDGVLQGTVGVAVDISKRKQAEEELRRSEATARALLNASTESSFIIDSEGRFLIVNDITGERLKTPVRELAGKVYYDFLPPDIALSRRQKVEQVRETKKSLRFSDTLAGMHLDHSIFPLFNDLGEVDRVAIFARDMTAVRLAEEALGRDLELNRAIADISTELLSESYDIGRVSDVALSVARKLTGSEHGFVAQIDQETRECVGHTLIGMQGEECGVGDGKIAFPIGAGNLYGGLWGHVLNTREPFFTNDPGTHPSSTGVPEQHVPLKNFLAVPVMMGEVLLGMIGLANASRDYTGQDINAIQRIAEVFALGIHRQGYEKQRSSMERSMRQLQKSEAIGALAGGIAHDFNNILSPIIGYSEFLLEDLVEEDPLRENVDQILAAANRARDLVKQILTFSRQHEQEVVALQPHLIIKEATNLVSATIPSTIEIRRKIDVHCRTIMADPTQIHQVAMNLMTNAYHAMEEDGGVLTVGLANYDAEPHKGGVAGLDPGPYVVLTVSDTGCGMSNEVLQKAFDPYFTTKPQGKGTGLGLSVVYGIIRNYKGEIVVDSREGEGSTFRVFLPAVAKTQVDEVQVDDGLHLRGSERILLVDDEPQILNLQKRLLERYGYQVVAKGSSQEALAEIVANPAGYDLVITDMTMPRMTGDRLTEEVRKSNPALPVLICTGFSEKISPEKARMIGAAALLMKPVASLELARTVREVLDAAAAGPGSSNNSTNKV